MGAWSFSTIAAAAHDKKTLEANSSSVQSSSNDKIISSPSMAVEDDENEEETEIYVPANPHIDPALRRIPGPCGFCGGIGDDYR